MMTLILIFTILIQIITAALLITARKKSKNSTLNAFQAGFEQGVEKGRRDAEAEQVGTEMIEAVSSAKALDMLNKTRKPKSKKKTKRVKK